MPRTGGIYNVPSGTKGTPNTTIQSSKYNALVDDLVADANFPRPVTAGGTGATSASGARTFLGLDPGVNIQAYDALLQSIANLTTTANQMIYLTGTDTAATTTITAYGRSLIDDADAAAARTTLALGSLATRNDVNDADWSGADLSIANGGTGASTAAAARTNLAVPSTADLSSGLATKVNVANAQMTDAATISGVRPGLYFDANSSNDWALDAFTDNSFRLVDTTAVVEVIKFFTTGAIWTRQLGDLQTYIDTKAPLASAVLTGTPRSTTPPTSDNSTRIATTAMVQAAVSGGSPTFFADTQALGAGSQQNVTGKPLMVNASRSATVGFGASITSSISSGPNSAGQIVRANNTISPDGGTGSSGVTLSATCSCIIPVGWWFTISLSGGVSASNIIYGTS